MVAVAEAEAEQEQQVTEELLNDFIVSKDTEIRNAKDETISKLQKKKKKMLKAFANDAQEDAKEADLLFEAAMFLRKTTPDKLMAMALFDKKVLSDQDSNEECTAEQRAILTFASNKAIKAEIEHFRGKYPKWKKAAKKLRPKVVVVKKDNTLSSALSNGNGSLSPESSKKSKKRKKEVSGIENGDVPKKKSKILPDETGIVLKSKTKKKLKNKKKTKTISNFVDNVAANGVDTLKKKDLSSNFADHNENIAPAAMVNEELSTPKNNSPSKQPKDQSDKMQKWQGGNLTEKNKNGREFFGGKPGFNNKQRGGRNFQKDQSMPKWKVKKFCDYKSSNLVNITPESEDKPSSPPKAEGSPPKAEGEEKSSLLRPQWLTNPEEHKYTPSPRPSPFQGRGNFRERGRGRGGRGFSSFRGIEANSANMVSVAPDWKEKMCTKKDDAGESNTGGSLLKPSWLTNPGENPPPPLDFSSFKSKGGGFRGRGRGRGRGGGRGRGRGRR